MKKFILIIFILSICFSCSGVYDASVEGYIYDYDEYHSSSSNKVGLGFATAYLYLDDAKRETDYAVYAEKGILPEHIKDKNGKDVKNYYSCTITNSDANAKGKFIMEGIRWESLFPKFGKSGDRLKVYFCFYHKDYGLIKFNVVYEISSGVRTKLPAFIIKKNIPEVIISGRVVDINKKKSNDVFPISGVTLSIYLPLEWSVNGTTVDVKNWDKNSKYSIKTDAEGYFEQKVAFNALNASELQYCKIAILPSMKKYSLYTLNTENNAKFIGLNSDGTVKNGEISSIERSPEYWVLFDGDVSETVEFWDESAEPSAKKIQSVGLAGIGIMKKDFDFDANGTLDIYTVVDLEYNAANRVNSKKLSTPIRMREIDNECDLTGVVKDATGKEIDGVTINFYDTEATYIAKKSPKFSVTSGIPVVGNSNQNIVATGKYSVRLEWTLYNYLSEKSGKDFWIFLSDGTKDVLIGKKKIYAGTQGLNFVF